MSSEIESKEDLEEKLAQAGNKLVLVFFFAAGEKCDYIHNLLNEIEKAHCDIMEVLKVDVEEVKELSCEYNIEDVPAFVFLKNGETLDTLIGDDWDVIEDLIVKHSE